MAPRRDRARLRRRGTSHGHVVDSGQARRRGSSRAALPRSIAATSASARPSAAERGDLRVHRHVRDSRCRRRTCDGGTSFEQRGHRRRMGRVRGVVVEPAQLGLDAVGRELVDVLRLAVEEVDPAGEHRDRAAAVREEPPRCRGSARRCPRAAGSSTARVVSCGTSITAGKVPTLRRAQQVGDQRVEVDDRLATVQLLEDRPVGRRRPATCRRSWSAGRRRRP